MGIEYYSECYLEIKIKCAINVLQINKWFYIQYKQLLSYNHYCFHVLNISNQIH